MRYILYAVAIISCLSCNRKSGELELCGLGILKPYYMTGLEYKGGLFAIKENYESAYVPVATGKNSGIVKIRFDVNCKGETGNFAFESYDLNYKPTELNDSIIEQTISIAKSLDDWIPGTNDENEPINSFKFLAIKLNNGEIREILPK